MTLKEKFIDAFKSGKRFDIQNAETIADDYAIEFAYWMLCNQDMEFEYESDNHIDGLNKLLEIFKKEKGL
jgi:hypothetical protein